jgi:hypothetical protein
VREGVSDLLRDHRVSAFNLAWRQGKVHCSIVFAGRIACITVGSFAEAYAWAIAFVEMVEASA